MILSNLLSNQFISAPIRLDGIGSSPTEGNILIFNKITNQWGGLCENNFDIADAHVICTMLGYPTATLALANGAAAELYGTASSGANFTLDNLGCIGTETSVFECPQSNEETNTCGPSQIAGVHCATSKIWSISDVGCN